MRRLIIDASVLLSATVSSPQSPSARLLRGARAAAFEPIACPRLIDGFRAGLRKPYFHARVAQTRAEEIVDAFALLATMLPDPIVVPAVLRDPADDYLVALAISAHAEAIVTGDRDLLDHADLAPPAWTPRAACESLGIAS